MVCNKPTCHKPVCLLARRKKRTTMPRRTCALKQKNANNRTVCKKWNIPKGYKRGPIKNTWFKTQCFTKKGASNAMKLAWAHAKANNRKYITSADMNVGYNTCGLRKKPRGKPRPRKVVIQVPAGQAPPAVRAGLLGGGGGG